MKYLTFPLKDHSYEVIFGPDKLIGHLYTEVDGYFYFLPTNEGGFWASHWMREIADKLDELNKPWDDQINEYFKAEEARENSNKCDLSDGNDF